MSSDLTPYLERFRDRPLLVVGGFALDRHCYGEAEDISPEAPVPVLRLTEELAQVGDAGHVAVALAALGARVVCCGAVGDDLPGEQLRQLLEEAGVDVTGLKVVPGWQTTTHTRLIGLVQQRHPQQMMRVEQASSQPLPTGAVDEIAKAIEELAAGTEAICVRDSDVMDWPEALSRVAIQVGRRTNQPVLVSPVSEGDWQRYRDATFLTPNRRKFARRVGESADRIARLGELAGPLTEALNLQGMVITLDRDGSLVLEPGSDPVHVPTRSRSVYDITGAGDVMLAVLGTSVAAGAGLADAARLANVAAGLSVERFGPVTLSRDEIRAELILEGRATVDKLRSLDALMAEVTPRRSAGSKLVFTNGCFDVLHAGHIQYFRFCREQGDILIVGLNSDDSVRSQGKGDDRPINNQLDRARMLSALEFIDYVTIFDEPTPERMIRRILPDVLVKGQDWAKWVCGKDVVEAAGGKVVLAPMMEGYSTSQLLAQIRGMEQRRERDD